jgi:hypothetical protein
MNGNQEENMPVGEPNTARQSVDRSNFANAAHSTRIPQCQPHRPLFQTAGPSLTYDYDQTGYGLPDFSPNPLSSEFFGSNIPSIPDFSSPPSMDVFSSSVSVFDIKYWLF